MAHHLTRLGFALGIAFAFCACGEAPVEAPEAAATAAEPVSLGGLYEVTGTTTEVASGVSREISGSLILAEQGGAYTTNFSFVTQFPTPDGNRRAEVIGTGEGIVDGRSLTGTAETQIVLATVGGIDPGFAFIPRTVSTRVQSETRGEIDDAGKLRFEVRTTGSETGTTYAETTTLLIGKRVADPSAARTSEIPEIAGLYDVTGDTDDPLAEDSRSLKGKMIISQDRERYTATFTFRTLFPTKEGTRQAEVIGSGTGRIKGRTLHGSSETQIIVSMIGGVDPGFAFVPRRVQARVQSENRGQIGADGRLTFEVVTRGASETEDYGETTTRFIATRIPSPKTLADVAGAP